jgi:hypothetical protein
MKEGENAYTAHLPEASVLGEHSEVANLEHND